MPTTKSIRAILTSGCRWSKECVWQVVELVDGQPRKLPQLVECLWDPDPFVASGAADALERLTRDRPSKLDPWKDALLGLLMETLDKRVRWNLALTIPRMKLNLAQCRRAKAALESFLDDKSSVVKTAALHGLADLARQDPASLREVVDLLLIAGRSGTPAMRARSRILLARLENPGKRQRQRVSLHMFT
jgi:HEAT repeat protein